MKVYKRKITSSMAYALFLIYKRGDNNYFHLEDYFKTLNIPSSIRGDAPKLRFWGLIVKDNLPRADGNPNTGYYFLTGRGRRFIEENLEVPKYAEIFNNQVKGFSSETITFKEALKNKFNYNELIQ